MEYSLWTEILPLSIKFIKLPKSIRLKFTLMNVTQLDSWEKPEKEHLKCSDYKEKLTLLVPH